jgi:hypothetical protein
MAALLLMIRRFGEHFRFGWLTITLSLNGAAMSVPHYDLRMVPLTVVAGR